MRYYTSLTDSELIDLLCQGDPSAFEEIYQRYSELLIRYATRRIDRREESEEFIQDIFVSLWTRRGDLRHIHSLRPYLFNMVKYKIVDYIRRSQVRKKFEEHYLLFEAVYENITPGEGAENDLHGLIEKSISALPERCRVAFRLRLDENLPYKDIAARMNISIKTVEKHISAALQHLRRAYPEQTLNASNSIFKLGHKNISS